MIDRFIGDCYGDDASRWVERRVDQGGTYDGAWREAEQIFPRLVDLGEVAFPENPATEEPAA